MARNKIFTMTQGANGTEMGFNLYDAAGRFTPSATVKIYVKRQGASVNVIDGRTCLSAGNYTIEGKTWDCKYQFQDSEMAFDGGTYLVRFVHDNGPSDLIYFPTDPSQWYGKIIINPAP